MVMGVKTAILHQDAQNANTKPQIAGEFPSPRGLISAVCTETHTLHEIEIVQKESATSKRSLTEFRQISPTTTNVTIEQPSYNNEHSEHG